MNSEHDDGERSPIALVDLGGVRRQGRRERDPRTRPEIGGRPRPRRARPGRSPPRTIASLPAPMATSSGHGQRGAPSGRPARPSSDATYTPVSETADDRQPELEARRPTGRRSRAARPANASGRAAVAEPPADHRARHGPDGDEQQVVGAQADARRARHAGGRSGRATMTSREGERLPAHDEIAEPQEGVEVERDDGDRHGRRSVPAAQVSAGRHLACRLRGRRTRAAGHTMRGIRLTALGAQTVAMRGNTSVAGGRRWNVPTSGPRGWAGRRDYREGTPWPLDVARLSGLDVTLLGRVADPDGGRPRCPPRRTSCPGTVRAAGPDSSSADARGDRRGPLARIAGGRDRAAAPGAVPVALGARGGRPRCRRRSSRPIRDGRAAPRALSIASTSARFEACTDDPPVRPGAGRLAVRRRSCRGARARLLRRRARAPGRSLRGCARPRRPTATGGR